MKKLNFSTTIQAPPEKVWQILWDDDTYRKWTSVFSPDSHAQTDNWKEGSKVLFLDGQGNGMVSTVAANKPNQFMSFQHLGEVHGSVEDTTSEKVKAWAGAFENYTLRKMNGGTELLVELDMGGGEFEDMFKDMFPRALAKVKELSEQ
jgi:uncharacterized protein YndB with AHSA1/START domain